MDLKCTWHSKNHYIKKYICTVFREVIYSFPRNGMGPNHLNCCVFVCLIFFPCLGFTARQYYFTHFEPGQSSGGAKTGNPREKHLTTLFNADACFKGSKYLALSIRGLWGSTINNRFKYKGYSGSTGTTQAMPWEHLQSRANSLDSNRPG